MMLEEKISLMSEKTEYTFEDLITIVEILRSEKGCPWDREQSHKSIRKDFIEETYEVIEAIDTENPELLREELGDVMLQVVFHTRIEEEAGRFDINGVAESGVAHIRSFPISIKILKTLRIHSYRIFVVLAYSPHRRSPAFSWQNGCGHGCHLRSPTR